MSGLAAKGSPAPPWLGLDPCKCDPDPWECLGLPNGEFTCWCRCHLARGDTGLWNLGAALYSYGAFFIQHWHPGDSFPGWVNTPAMAAWLREHLPREFRELTP